MSDREFGGNDDLSLPKGTLSPIWAATFLLTAPTATVQKIIAEILANDPGVTFAKDTRDLLIECCVEFITLISSEANEIAEKDSKKTIACNHVETALSELGFGDYVPAILEVAADFKKQQAVRSIYNHDPHRILTRDRAERRSSRRSNKAGSPRSNCFANSRNCSAWPTTSSMPRRSELTVRHFVMGI